MILILIICAIATGLYFLNSNYKYWSRRGVPGPKPIFLVGNLLDNFLGKKSIAELYSEVYRNFPNAPMVGIFKAGTPTLVIRDPELIKEITVKSFQHFRDNDLYIDKAVDFITGGNPFFMRGDDWKATRAHLTPGFTSSKIRSVHPLLEDVSRALVKYIEKQPEGCNAKELCKRFTLNNVGICVFGVNAKCFDEEDPEFKQIADRFLTPDGFQTVKFLLVGLIPVMTKLVSIRFTPKDVEAKLTNLVEDTLKYREANNIVRNDYLQILHQLAKTKPEFTEKDITAHAAGFFADGYETSSIVMHFALYELAANSVVQEKLRQEIDAAFEENKGSLPYEVLQQLGYLDAVFKETLRLHPPLGSLNKICTKAYTYVPNGGVIKEPVLIEEGTPVILPLYALQRDPEYFDDPDAFKPERFLEEDKEVSKYTYLPFGEGPRACLGQRFGSLQLKIGLAYIIRNFEVSVNGKTERPIKYDPVYFLTMPKSPLRLDFKKIR